MCPHNRLVDMMDVFNFVSSSQGAAKTMKSKYFGQKSIEETKMKYNFTDIDMRTTIWNNDKNQRMNIRSTLPINIMISILKDVQTSAAAQLWPELKNALEKAVGGTLTVRNTETVEPRATAENSGVALNTVLPPPVDDKIANAEVQFELQKIAVASTEHVNDSTRREEIANAEHTGKKAKIAGEASNQEMKMKLAALICKYDWAKLNNMDNLATKIEKMIEDL